MESAEIARVAAGLTDQQRGALLKASVDWKQIHSPGTGAYKGARMKPLVDYSGWEGQHGWRHSVRLSGFGIAVRDYILKGTGRG